MKEQIRALIYNVLWKMPNCILRKLAKTIKKFNESYHDQIEEVRLKKFLYKTDFSSIDVSKMPICNIKIAEWDYPLFNMAFLVNMLQNIVYCLSNGYRPVVQFSNSHSEVNLWEEFLLQPYSNVSLKFSSGVIECDVKTALLRFPIFPVKKDVEIIGKLFEFFVVPNENTESYVQKEYDELLHGKRVIGVLCRGTDYKATKPKWHPIQPEIEEVIEEVKIKMLELECDAIYLATEEQTIQEWFEKEFPGKVIVNKRNYFDSYYDIKESNPSALISAVHFERENDSYYKALEYFSSIMLLSKCCALIGGNCGGSRAALYINNNKFEYSHLFDKGLY